MTITETPVRTAEKQDALETLAKHRFLLRHTVQGLTDEQAALTPTASELCLGGLIKHVTITERNWVRFMLDGAAAPAGEAAYAAHAAGFRMLPGETLDALLADYDAAALATEAAVDALPSLDVAQALPAEPWFEPGAAWTARRVLLHLVAETAQHAGHADILRETIDGQKSMG